MENVSTMPSEKRAFIAFLLVFFFGVLGLHRFYVGKVGSGIAMLVLTFTLVGVVVSGVWAFVDFITILASSFRDADGRKLTNW